MHVPPHTLSRALLLFRKIAVLGLCVLGLSLTIVSTADAQLHGREYSGVVMFDRWDSCFLISGTVTYISRAAKEALRPYNGVAIQIHAHEIKQHSNPGDVLIQSFDILGPAPDTHRYGVLDGLELMAEPNFSSGGNPAFFIQIRNTARNTAVIMSSSIVPILLGPSPRSPYTPPTDEVSVAIVTRGNMLTSPFIWRSYDGKSGERSAGYTVDSATPPLERFQLAPGESRKFRIRLSIPEGQYQFLFGYGGGFNDERSLVSNSISFNVTDSGVVTLVNQ